MSFQKFSVAVAKQLDKMIKHANEEGTNLLRVDISKEEIWDAYMNAFPAGTNEILKERREYDCNTCKQFIRGMGNAVALIDGKMVTVWDVEAEGYYKDVAKSMAELVKSKNIAGPKFTNEMSYGTPYNYNQAGGTHFHFHTGRLSNVVYKGKDAATLRGQIESQMGVAIRSVNTITDYAIDTVLELIRDNLIYRGSEHKQAVTAFKKFKKEAGEAKSVELYCWSKSGSGIYPALIRNTAIGTLLIDLSEGVDLEVAVRKFENVMAPANYKRPKSLVTPKMIEAAEKTVVELGLMDSLARRHAVVSDLTINNVLFANRGAAASMAASAMGGVFSALKEEVKDSKLPDASKVQEIHVDEFLGRIMPGAQSIQVAVNNGQMGNFMSLVAPVNKDAKPLFQWDNGFSWSYTGEVTDSIKELVKAAGGKVDAHIRFSLAWHNYDDLDFHLETPRGTIYFGDKRHSFGELDVDMNAGSGTTRSPVENIVLNKNAPDGDYKLKVHNFSQRESRDVGYTVQVVVDGAVTEFSSKNNPVNRQYDTILTFTLKNGVMVKSSSKLSVSSSQKDVWGVQTNKWQNVSMILNSPNHWDEKQVGNKHLFFMLEGCKNPDPVRGFYNEFLRTDLNEHRKVFEVLASKMRVEPADDQLSGVGFSMTKRDKLLVRVDNRPYVVVF